MADFDNELGKMFTNNSPGKKTELSFKQINLEMNNERMNSLKMFYEIRMHSLDEIIKEAVFQINNDELMKTMKNDNASNEFSLQRIKEIFEEVVNSDREIIIDKLLIQYSYLKTEFSKIEDEKKKVAYRIIKYFN